MDKVITYNLNEDFIQNLADFVEENFQGKGADISRLAFVFEGKRPAMFLKRALSKKMKKGFFSPRFFSIDEFVQYTLSKKTPFVKIPDMESWHMLYTLAGDIAPEIAKGREKFSQFLPWAREISLFIDRLDIEGVPRDALKNVQASASIGYEIPENINESLKNIIALRDAYHKLLVEKNLFPRGFMYLSAAEAVKEAGFDEFDRILFCGFDYMPKTEQEIIRHIYDSGKAILFFQGDEDKWPVLKKNAQDFKCSIKPVKKQEGNPAINLYTAFDRHSQVCAVREILKKIKKLDSTVIVLPDANTMIPLVSELGSSFGEFNVSLGYPLLRSSLYSLFEFIVRAQKTKKDDEYYAKDYIAALSQPLVKNLKLLPDYGSTRVLVHKIEEALLGMEETSISGNLFVRLEDVENEKALFDLAAETLRNMNIDVRAEDLRIVLKKLHHLLFGLWENISSFRDFAASIGEFLDTLLRKSFMENFPLNLKIADRIYSIKDELENASFSKEEFIKEDIFKIFQNMLENVMVSFSGSPLKGLQILGSLETRSLNFENVIIMDLNEGVLPSLRVQDPLIPHDVTMGLGIDIVAEEEERQRYLFKRIVSAAKHAHLVYEENTEKERSRFIEELIWQAQKKEKRLDVMDATQAGFSVNVLPARTEVKKTGAIIEFLKDFSYSATSVNTYIQCPLQFYYSYVLGLKEKEELIEEPEGREIGTLIHELLKETFEGFINKKPKINREFRKCFFKAFDERFKKTFGKRMRSNAFLLKDVMRVRLERFLDFEETDEKRNVKEVKYLEEGFREKIKLSGDTFNFKYVVDRVDKLEDGSILIIDYKTGSDTLKPQKTVLLEAMEMKREAIRDRIRSFQLPLYYYFEKKKYQKEVLNAALYSLRKLKLTYLFEEKTKPEKTMEVCVKALDFILHEILDPRKAFAADHEKEAACRYCPFSYLCR